MTKNLGATVLLLFLSGANSLLHAACCPINPTPTTTYAVASNAVSFSQTVNGCFTIGDTSGNISTYTPTSSCTYATTPSSTANIGGTVTNTAYSQEGCLVATTDSQAFVYEPAANSSCFSCDYSTNTTHISAAGVVASVAFSPAPNNCLALALGGGNVAIYAPTSPDSCSYNTVATTTVSTGAPNATAVIFDRSACLIVGDSLGNVTIFPQQSVCSYITAIFSQRIVLGGTITALAVTSTGCLAVGDSNGQVTIYAQTGLCTYTLTTTITAAAIPTALAFIPGGNCLVVGDSTGNINAYNNTSGCSYSTTAIPIIVGSGSPITSLSFSPNGCLAAAFDTIVNIFPPDATLAVTTNPTFSIVCTGGTITITANATGGSGTYTYAWTGPNGFTATGNPITIPDATKANAGQYTVTVTDSAGCTATASSFISIETIGLALSASPATICDGQSSTLTATITGGTAPYTVTFSGFPPVVTSSTIVTQVVSPLTTTSYTVTVTDSTVPPCTVTSNVVTVTVNPLPTPAITSASANCNGTITIMGTGTPGDTIEVFNGATEIAVPATVSGAGLFSITTISLAPGTYTTLTLKETDSAGCTTTIPVPAVTVNPALGVTISGPPIACFGTTLSLTANPTGGSGTYPNYAWTGPDGFSQTGPSNTITIPNITLANAGNYTVTVTDSDGCIASASLFVQVIEVGATLSASEQFLCLGQSSTLTATIVSGSPPYTAVFSDGHTVTNIVTHTVTYIVTPTTTTTYTVTITDSNGCSVTSNPVTITVNTPTTPTITTVVVNCNGTVAITGTADPGDTITILNGMTIIAGPILVPGSGIYSIVTPVLPPATYTLTIQATNGFACTASVQTMVTVFPTIGVSIAPPSQFVCPDSTITLTANATGGTGIYVNYAWTGPDGFSQTGPSNTVTIPDATPANAGTYSVTVTDSNSCTATGTASVTVSTLAVTLTPPTQSVCFGNTLTITANATGGTPPYVNYQWSGPNGFSQTGPSNSISIPSVIFANTGTYNVVVTDSVGCTVSGNAFALVIPCLLKGP